MAARRLSSAELPPAPTEVELGGRSLAAGEEASVRFPGRSSRTRARFVRVERDGSLTFVDPRTGGLRSVGVDAVGTVHRKRRLR